MADDLIVEISDRVATLTMNRPERRNALSPAMLNAMLDTLPEVAENRDVGAVILTGTGGAFCSGGDVKAMAEGSEFAADDLEGKVAKLRSYMEVSRWLHEMPKPTIAVIPGPAAGAGLSIALACDIRVAASSAKFTTAFGRVGYSGDFGGSYFLSKIIGTGKARELYYTADLIDAETAHALGMINRLVSDDELMVESRALAAQLASGPSIALGYMKRNMNTSEHAPLTQLLDMEALHHTRCGMTEDHKEAAKAFVEKRTPVFRGR